MAWRDHFISWLNRPYKEPVYLFETVELTDSTAGDFAQGREQLQLSSSPIPGHHAKAWITRDGSRVTYGGLTPRTWDRTFGSMTIALVPGIDVRHLCTRGQAVRLSVGAAGWRHDLFEQVWLGTIRDVVWRGGRWYVECAELIGSLQNRFAAAADRQHLFYDLADTELDSDFVAGTGDPFDVANAPSWEFDSNAVDESSFVGATPAPGVYVLKITSNDGDDFYVTATTLTSATFSVLDESRFGTTAADADTGNRVREVAYSQAHPIRIAARILTSSGVSGLNGVDDVFPTDWGYAIRPEHVDREDMNFWVDQTGGDEVMLWQLFVEAQQTDGYRWLSQWLQPGGFFLALHQGRLTVRALVEATGAPTPGNVTVNDEDHIVEIVEYNAYDPDCQVEYRGSKSVGKDGVSPQTAAEGNIATHPAKVSRRRDVLALIDLITTPTWNAEIAGRLGVWDTRVPERMTIRTAGWGAACASLGDQVQVTTSLLTRRDGTAFDSDGAVMIGGGCDWFGGTCELELLFLPQLSSVA